MVYITQKDLERRRTLLEYFHDRVSTHWVYIIRLMLSADSLPP